jgi:small redox-active disulfide protein 2
MKIQVLGAGCPRCMETERNVFSACSELGLAADISHIFDQEKIKEFGPVGMPTVLINDKIVVSGSVPTVQEMKKIIVREKENIEE